MRDHSSIKNEQGVQRSGLNEEALGAGKGSGVAVDLLALSSSVARPWALGFGPFLQIVLGWQ